jgi:acetyltransferase-like isoleucine patch superfamily enzyme
MRTDWRRVPWRVRYQFGERVATRLRRAAIALTHQHCTVEFRGRVRLGPGFSVMIPGPGTLVVGDGVDFRRGFVCEISGTGRVAIGDRAIFTSHALIQCSTSIEIGEEAMLGQDLFIADGNHRFRDWRRNMLEQGYDYRPIRIGARAAINTKSTILNSVGEGAIVGANSVVTRPVPAYCVAVGAPARVIDYFGPPELRPPELEERIAT